jgi:hypothetical protein
MKSWQAHACDIMKRHIFLDDRMAKSAFKKPYTMLWPSNCRSRTHFNSTALDPYSNISSGYLHVFVVTFCRVLCSCVRKKRRMRRWYVYLHASGMSIFSEYDYFGQ